VIIGCVCVCVYMRERERKREFMSYISRGIGWPFGKSGDNRLRVCMCLCVCVRERERLYVIYIAGHWVANGKER